MPRNNQAPKDVKIIIKNYRKWMAVKSKINNSEKVRKINEGDVVWVAMGENVGVEIDGKNEKYSRPVIILKKHNNLCFTGVPLTSRPHEGTWYVDFEFQGRRQTAVLVQTKLMDVHRIYNRMGELSKADYKKILEAYIQLLLGK